MGLLASLLGRPPEGSEFRDAEAMAREIARLRGAYLQLMKDCLTGFVYKDPGHDPNEPQSPPAFRPEMREIGIDWPHQAHSMIGNKRMLNLREACETVIAERVPGDFIETGVWRGGACIFMRAVLQAHGVVDRTVWVADSFAGLPPPDEEAYPHDRGSDFHKVDALAIPLEIVQDNFRGYGLLDERVRFLKGWFKDTLPSAPIERLAILRLDGDMYESTMDALRALYHKVSPGGFVIVDDYSIPNCRRAVDDFRATHGITEPVHAIDPHAAYWRKGRASRPGPRTGLLARLRRHGAAAEFADAAAMSREIARLRGAYLRLMKDCLIGAVYRDPGINPYTKEREVRYDAAWRENGVDWPTMAQSMIGNRRMIALWEACEDVIVRGVPGDFIETGVWRGGACIFMRAILNTYGITDRTVWVADSFRGLPPPDAQAYPADAGSPFHSAPELLVSLETVRENFRGYGLLDGQVRFLEGWFKDTLPAAPIERLAILRLDGDMYESTMDALRALHGKLSPGGYVIVDDYSIPNCYKAVQDFRAANGIVAPVRTIDNDAAYWIKGER